MIRISLPLSLISCMGFKCEETIIGGDFNLVFDVEKDKKGGIARTHKRSLEVVQEYSENLDLVDAWRALNPEASRYTAGSIFFL